MAGGSAHHLAQRRHRRAEHAGRGPLCARVRLRDLRWHRRDRRLGRDGAVIGDLHGSAGPGGTVPLFVTSDGIGGTDGLGGAVPLGDGRGRVVAGPGSGRGAAGSGMVSSLGTWGPPQRPRRPLAGGRPERCDGERAGARPLAGAQQGRRQLPAAAAQGGRYRAGPVAGTGGCARAEPPAASLPLLCDGMTSGCARPGQGRAPCGLDVAGLHRVTAAARPGSWPGSVHQAPARSAGTRHCERHGHQRS